MEEEDLISGDMISFNEIMETYGESVKRLIYTYVRDWSVAEDLTQDVFVIVYLKLETFEQRSSLKTWICSIAINKCKDFIKSWNFRKVKLINNLPEKYLVTIDDNPESQMIQNDEELLVAKSILSLPVKYREIIILFYYQEMQIADIRDTLGLNESTVKTRLQRGRGKLKKLLGGVDIE
ncbi:RNA polymerase sigma-70 factor, ECF subfamily [Virgibacillus subterraneus]|uniref:RNA polymerase sigma factor n=1 Tax=Virgibacillus subterraneus TaxID=621109 RepID=A0A1H9K6B3_9BACI|nr:sigma-70 family RNA polymerase sigma factor [Virgibacillus subterraneus]SEQ94660.1 RNA polymerase sigma-70 factor, ECF subfamily [Virgibacillus subterraneus]